MAPAAHREKQFSIAANLANTNHMTCFPACNVLACPCVCRTNDALMCYGAPGHARQRTHARLGAGRVLARKGATLRAGGARLSFVAWESAVVPASTMAAAFLKPAGMRRVGGPQG